MADISIAKSDLTVLDNGKRLYCGIGTFNSTDASGSLAIGSMNFIDDIQLTPLDAPAALSKHVVHLMSTGSLSGTFAFTGRFPEAGTVTSVWLITQNTISTNGTNFWSFDLTNKGAAGVGTAKIVDSATAANTTNSGGSALAAYTPLALTLTSANVAVAAGDTYLFAATATMTPTAFAQSSFGLTYATAGTDEKIYCSQSRAGGRIVVPSSKKITISRTGAAKTSGLAFSFAVAGR